MTCSTDGIRELVEEAAGLDGSPSMSIFGPNQPRRNVIGEARQYDCPEGG
jgi:hypothetical protein